MRNVHVASMLRRLLLVAMVVTVGLASLVLSQTTAAGPQIDCGPTRQWICVLPRCEECPEILFEGTVCEKAQFEKETGRICSPA